MRTEYDSLYFGGRWLPPSTGERITVVCPQGAADEGARTVVGGAARPAGVGNADGWYVAPTVLADVDNAITVAREEIFGPVVCVIAYDHEDEAVRIANDSPFGLAGSVWSDHKSICGAP
jgi:acyl-CoA reductase-like NAD-dependent aldehyde dehydrogenase